MTAYVTRAKSATECGYTAPDPRDELAELRRHLGLAEGHLAELHRLLRAIEDHLDPEPEDHARRAA